VADTVIEILSKQLVELALNNTPSETWPPLVWSQLRRLDLSEMIMSPGTFTSFLAHMEVPEILCIHYSRFADASSDPSYGDDTPDQMNIVQAMLPQQSMSKVSISRLNMITMSNGPTIILGLLKALEPIINSYHLLTLELDVSDSYYPGSTPSLLAHLFRVWGATWSPSPPSVTLRITARLIAERSPLDIETEHHQTLGHTSTFKSILYQVDHSNPFKNMESSSMCRRFTARWLWNDSSLN
jgi:hypothetical protein